MENTTHKDNVRFYISQALFQLMEKEEYAFITISKISEKAGIGRATFYRYYKSKDEIIMDYFAQSTELFLRKQIYRPNNDEEFTAVMIQAFTLFRENKKIFVLLKKAKLESLYLDFLNRSILDESLASDGRKLYRFAYPGALYNVSMKWMEEDYKTDIETLAKDFVATVRIYREGV